jgi:hypothetical protein
VHSTRRACLAHAFFALEAHAAKRRRKLRNEVGDAANRPTVAGEIRQPMTIAQLLSQLVDLRHQSTAFGRRE